MIINKAILYLMKQNGITQMRMAELIGKKRPNDVSSRLLSKNMSFDKALEMLNAIGYDIVIQRSGNPRKGQIVLQPSSEDAPAEPEHPINQ